MTTIKERVELPLKLDIGCGGRGSKQKGFIGIDIWPLPEGKTEDEYKQLDFVNDELPWKENTVDEAIALHIIEHLMPDDGEILIRRAIYLLKPGCTLTVTCPDLRRLCYAYVFNDEEFLKQRHLSRGKKEIWPGHTLADRLNWAIHQETHKWAYDLESLSALAERAGDFNHTPIYLGHRWSTRPGLEIGLIIKKDN